MRHHFSCLTTSATAILCSSCLYQSLHQNIHLQLQDTGVALGVGKGTAAPAPIK